MMGATRLLSSDEGSSGQHRDGPNGMQPGAHTRIMPMSTSMQAFASLRRDHEIRETPMNMPRSRVACVLRCALPVLALGAMTAMVPEPAHATITSDAQPVVDRYVQATGGAAALAAEHATHGRFTLNAFGLTGRVESWTRLPSSSASRT